MYAVITGGRLSYLGECQDEALDTFNSKPNSSLHLVESQEELDELLDTEVDVAAIVSDSFTSLVGKLSELGVNQDLPSKLRDNSVKLMGEAKSLGVKGMKAVGEGFVALGELLRKASAETTEDCCGDPKCCQKK